MSTEPETAAMEAPGIPPWEDLHERADDDLAAVRAQGRKVVLDKCLTELEAAGEVESRRFPRGRTQTVRRYRWKP